MKLRLTRVRVIVCLLVAVVVSLAAWLRFGAIPAGLLDERQSVSTVVVDRHGEILYETLSAGGARQLKLDSRQLPETLVAATLAAEDRRFWLHPGVDPLALVRAAVRNALARRIEEGGSTVTQQVAKLLIARREGHARRGVRAKLREAVLALRLEHRFSKREILAMYLDLASYGNQVVGAERAAVEYFGCRASMLTPAQAAFLAALPQQPSRFNPYRGLERARARQVAILGRMRAAGFLSAQRAKEALAERLVLARSSTPFTAPHFVEMVLASAGEPRPARIETTLDAELQGDVLRAISSYREALRSHGAWNVAVVVLENSTGEWLAWEGSGDYFAVEHGGAINGPVTPRQPGSALKPLTYAVAFEQGHSPATVLPDVLTHFPTAEPGVFFTPRNYDGRYRGPLLARRALAGSENVPAVALASEAGVPALLRFFSRAGLSTFDKTASHYGLGITLGNAEVKLAELVAAYSAFARGGTWLRPTAVRESGRDLDRSDTGHTHPLVSARTAFWITDILSDPDAREYIFGRGGSLEFPFPVAVKTGTSQAYHDNWTIGYTRAVTVGVWVGNFDRTPLRASSGVTGAAPIFHSVMLAAERRVAGRDSLLATTPLQTPPEGMVNVELCALSGMRANPGCPARIHEWLPVDEQTPFCEWHHRTDEGLLVVWPPEYREWAAQHGLLQDLLPAQRPAGHGVTRAAETDGALQPAGRPNGDRLAILNPPPGAVYSIDPTLRREFQAIALRVRSATSSIVDWQVDGARIGEARSEESVMWPLARGRHTIAARDAAGHRAQVEILVK